MHCKHQRFALTVALFLALIFLVSHAQASQVHLSWSSPTSNADGTPLTDLAGYHVYYWQLSWDMPTSVDVGNQTILTLLDLDAGQTYHFAITASDTSGNESVFSNTVSVTMPLPDSDTDDDGLSDVEELTVYGTDPNNADTDGDGIDDGAEIILWGAAWQADNDSDGLINLLDPDADNDGFTDGEELSQDSDPGDATSTPSLVQMVIEAEDYNTGGEGVGYHDRSVGNACGAYRQDDVDIQPFKDGGFYICQIQAGEWLAYDVDVPVSGSYELDIRVSNTQSTTAALHLEVDGVNVTGTVVIPITGPSQWTTITQPGINITAGLHILKLAVDGGGFKLDQLQLMLVQ
jgi:hypothetical protein